MMITDSDGNELALFYPKSERQQQRKDEIAFISADSHLIQVGIWNEYRTTHAIDPHTHLPLQREASGTHEMFYVESGRISAYIYDNENQPSQQFEMGPGDILVQLSGGHMFEVLEDDTVVIEAKNGPYMGKSADKQLIEVGKW